MTRPLSARLLALLLLAACVRPPATPPPAPDPARTYAGVLRGEWLELCAVDGAPADGVERLAWTPAAARQFDRAVTVASLGAVAVGQWDASAREDGTLRLTPAGLLVAGAIYVRVRAVAPPPPRPAPDGTITTEVPGPALRVIALIDAARPPAGRCP